MNIGSVGTSLLLGLISQAKSQRDATEDASSAFQPQADAPANLAASLSILPSSSAVKLSFDNILALQTIEAPAFTSIKETSAEDKFLAEARKTPMQRMREQVMEQLGLSEDALAQMTPEQRRAAEDQIRQMIEERLRQGMNADGAPPESNAAMLQTLA